MLAIINNTGLWPYLNKLGDDSGSSVSVFEVAPHPHFYHQIVASTMTNLPLSDHHIYSTEASGLLSEDITEDPKFRLPVWGICIMTIGYVCVFIFGVIGNCSVLIVVARLHRMKTVTNYFICNLALADLLVLLFCLLPNLISNIFIPWILGWLLCKIVPFVQGVSICASVYSLVAISMERCISIQWPFQHQITKRKAKKIMIAIWIWSCSIAAPWFLYFDLYKADEEHPDLDFCVEKWPVLYQSWSRYYFLVGNFIICYLLPLGIIFICYLCIWFRVHRRPVPNDSNHKSPNLEVMHNKAKTAVLKMLLVVVLIFALSFLPLYLISTYNRFAEHISDFENEIISFIYPIAQWLCTFNSAVNPVVYSFLNKKFRHGFQMIFKCSWKDPLPPIRTHKSPTVNILLRRMAVYKVRTSSMCNESDDV